jgi:Predicted dehydrogenases and related proteins
MTDVTTEHGIAIVGAGTIVEHGHLPAYAAAGLPVKAIYDVDRDAAALLAGRYGLRVIESLDELLADDEIDIVDIAVTPTAQVDIAERALRAGRHVLCQKPLAPGLDQARRLVMRSADAPGVCGVNQQMRYEPIVASVYRHLHDGSLGTPISAQIFTNMSADFPQGHWLAEERRLMALYGTIHFLDSARYLFGEPSSITAKIRRDPAQVAVGETSIYAWVEWADGLLLNISERYTNWANDLQAWMRVEGSAGTVRGRFGIWDQYPNPSPSTVEFKLHDEHEWTTESSDRTWMPDAFEKPMTQLMTAIDRNEPHPISWEDNLRTLALVEAIYESDASGRTIDLAGVRR